MGAITVASYPFLPRVGLHAHRQVIEGQLIIPASLRAAHHWQEGAEFLVEEVPEGLLLRPRKPFRPREFPMAWAAWATRGRPGPSTRWTRVSPRQAWKSAQGPPEKKRSPALPQRSLLAPYALGLSFLLRGDRSRLMKQGPAGTRTARFETRPHRRSRSCAPTPRSIGTRRSARPSDRRPSEIVWRHQQRVNGYCR